MENKLTMSEEPKHYEIKSIEQLINVVNDENKQRLATDLALWLLYAAEHYKTIREKHPKECEGKTNWQIAQCAFQWIDDGKNDYLGTEVHANETGEVTFIKNSSL